jgi:DNA-binding NtrC family response regulator
MNPKAMVLVDRATPRVNGNQLTEAIQELAPRVPVILTTGFETTSGADEHHPRQPDLILAKPFSRASSGKAIGSALAV